jgi:diacylglycerol kinase family enzyme
MHAHRNDHVRVASSPMRVLLLVNATASSVTSRSCAKLRRLLSEQHDVEVAETSRRGHATRLAHAAAHDGFDVVAVFGGDGTLNEAAEGLLHSHTALAPIPGGSTNVYARALGYPNDARRAAYTVLAALRRGSTKRIGVGIANRRPFLFNAGIGFDAAVVRGVERHPRLKRAASHPAHVMAALAAFFGGEGTRTRVDIELDSGEVIEDTRFAIFSKADPYTYLGRIPLRVAPDAGIDKPLTVTAFRSLDFVTLVGGAFSTMRSGQFLAGREGVDQRGDVHHAVVRSPEPFGFQVDGEDIGDTQQLDITYEADALTIVLP